MPEEYYVVPKSDLTGIADTIRAKGGTSALLSLPDGFKDAIEAIPSGGSVGPYDWISPGATLHSTYTFRKTLAETDFATWTPATSAQKILGAQACGSAFTVTDLDQYDYYVIQKFDFVPGYKAGATLKTTVARYISFQWGVFSASYNANITANPSVDMAKNFTMDSLENQLFAYYNSSGALLTTGNFKSTSNTYARYGVYVNGAPSLSVSGTWPNITLSVSTSSTYAKAQSSYCTTTRMEELDQNTSKFTYVVDIVKAPIYSMQSKAIRSIADIYNNPL